jgi:uncharacterized membrane protein
MNIALTIICVLCAVICLWARYDIKKRIDQAIRAINGMGLGILKIYKKASGADPQERYW